MILHSAHLFLRGSRDEASLRFSISHSEADLEACLLSLVTSPWGYGNRDWCQPRSLLSAPHLHPPFLLRDPGQQKVGGVMSKYKFSPWIFLSQVAAAFPNILLMFVCFLGPDPWHMDVPRLRVELALQLPAIAQLWQRRIWAASGT